MKFKISIILGLLFLSDFHVNIGSSHNQFDNDDDEELMWLSSSNQTGSDIPTPVQPVQLVLPEIFAQKESEKREELVLNEKQQSLEENLKFFQSLSTDQLRIAFGWMVMADPNNDYPDNLLIVDPIPKNLYKSKQESEPMYPLTVGQVRKFLKNPPLVLTQSPIVLTQSPTQTPSKEVNAYAHFKDATWDQIAEALIYLEIIPAKK